MLPIVKLSQVRDVQGKLTFPHAPHVVPPPEIAAPQDGQEECPGMVFSLGSSRFF